MKKLILLIVALFCVAPIFSQIGINTTDPTATLDVNGSIRVRNMNPGRLQAIKLLGVDEHGTLIQLKVDENVYIDGNSVRASIIKEKTAIYPTIITDVIDNVPGIIWPGGAGNGVSVVRLESTRSDTEITGIDVTTFAIPMDAHGYTVSFYSVTGDIKLKNDDNSSLPVNRFILKRGRDMDVLQYETVKIMYDGILQRWLVVSKH